MTRRQEKDVADEDAENTQNFQNGNKDKSDGDQAKDKASKFANRKKNGDLYDSIKTRIHRSWRYVHRKLEKWCWRANDGDV